jgi:hypothetical protein
MKLNDRISAVVSASAEVGSLGKLTSQDITEWIELELGQFLGGSDLQRYGLQHCLTLPLSPILHIVSGNTPQAAWQSLLRGVLVGARNWVKIPKEGLPEGKHLALRDIKRFRTKLEQLNQAAVKVSFAEHGTGSLTDGRRHIPKLFAVPNESLRCLNPPV